MNTLEYRKRQYASKYADIIQNLTADNIADYFLDIINILCIPYNIVCYKSSKYINTASIYNGVLTPILHYNFYRIKLNKGFLYGHNITHIPIDVSKLFIIHDIMKLLCTVGSTSVELHYYDSIASSRLNICLSPDAKLNCNTSVYSRIKYILCRFEFNTNEIALRIDNIKNALQNAYNGNIETATATATATAHIKLETADATLAPLAEAKIVA